MKKVQDHTATAASNRPDILVAFRQSYILTQALNDKFFIVIDDEPIHGVRGGLHREKTPAGGPGPPSHPIMSRASDHNRGLIAGAAAGISARIVTAPIDLLKIRFQMETASHPSAKTYRTIVQSVKSIYATEGITAFWKGNTAGIWLYGTFSAVQFWTFNHTTALLGVGPAGGTAAMMATIVTYPFDLVRTRMALQAHHPEIYGTLRGTVRHIANSEGPTGFYKGIGPSLAQVIPYMGLSFHLHHRAKAILSKWSESKSLVDFVAGGFAGVASKTIMMPFDVVRKRLQIQGSPYKVYAMKTLPRYSGLADCVRTMWLTEGFVSFYRGLGLAILKSGPATATTFLVYGFLD